MIGERVVRHWRRDVMMSARGFESRWSRLTLKRVDPELFEKLTRQHDLFDVACVTGTVDQVKIHGEAMLRGYAAATKAMEQAGVVSNACLVGWDAQSGIAVGIGDQKAAWEEIRERYGEKVVFFSPDEIACLIGAIGGVEEVFKRVGEIKRAFPGAEVVGWKKRSIEEPVADNPEPVEGNDQ